MKSPPSVYVVDDDRSFRSALGELADRLRISRNPVRDQRSCSIIRFGRGGLHPARPSMPG